MRRGGHFKGRMCVRLAWQGWAAQPLCLFEELISSSVWPSLLSCVLHRNSFSTADGSFIWLTASLTEWIRPSPVENWQHSRIALSLWLSQTEFAAVLHTDAPNQLSAQRGRRTYCKVRGLPFYICLLCIYIAVTGYNVKNVSKTCQSS